MDFLYSLIMAILHKNSSNKIEASRHAKRNWKKHGSKVSFSNTVLILSVKLYDSSLYNYITHLFPVQGDFSYFI